MHSELIVADEPTTALDVNVQRVILETIAELRQKLGVAILAASHDLPVHAQLAERIGIMYAGQIVEIGRVRPVVRAPLHPCTQGLMASIPAIGGARRRLSGIASATPSPLSWPQGCRFHPRCPHQMEVCTRESPILAEIRPGRRTAGDVEVEVDVDRFAACHFHLESTPAGRRS